MLALFLPYHVDVPMRRVPWLNWVLIGTTCLVSLAGMGAMSQEHEDAWVWKWCLSRGEDFRIYQLLTHLFVHADLLHLGSNMFFLFLFGNAINAKLGHGRFLAAYLVAGIFGGLVWLASGGGDILLGASGAICGITGMFLVLYPLNEVATFYVWYIFWIGDMGILYWSSIWVILIFVLVDLIGAFFWWHNQAVAYVAHLGGYFFGISAAVILLVMGWIKPDEGEVTLLQYLGIRGQMQVRRRKKKRSLIRRKPPSEPKPPTPPPTTHWGSWGD